MSRAELSSAGILRPRGAPIYCGWFVKRIFGISLQKTKYQPNACILRETQISQFYRYAKKIQISLDPKKYRYVGVICNLIQINNLRNFRNMPTLKNPTSPSLKQDHVRTILSAFLSG
jgi:hypothetical protein